MNDNGKIRVSETGATRNSSNGKADYCDFFSPLTFKAYGEYMYKHRLQSDGTMRDPGNWKKLFGDDHSRVCLESAMRHLHDVWMELEGYESRDGLDEALGGLMFNVQALWHKVELDKRND
jgi:hypothetical protein